MGHGTYSVTNRTNNAEKFGYATASIGETFKQRTINNAMNPHGIQVRESRDSVQHPNSFAIILGLDVTGSMGSVPHFLVKEGLPHIMDKIIQNQEPDPQLLFLGIGDHECDSSPLQVGQFESSDELLDKWLTDVYLEGGGGGNAGESYLLAWYFAAQHTAIDCFEKRQRKGLLFTIGDEPCLTSLPKTVVRKLMGEGQFEDYTAAKLLEKAREKYEVYHIHVKETASGSRQEVINGWKQLIADNLLIANRSTDIANVITEAVLKHRVGTTTTGTTSEEEIL
jgi:hypothetical protein